MHPNLGGSDGKTYDLVDEKYSRRRDSHDVIVIHELVVFSERQILCKLSTDSACTCTNRHRLPEIARQIINI